MNRLEAVDRGVCRVCGGDISRRPPGLSATEPLRIKVIDDFVHEFCLNEVTRSPVGVDLTQAADVVLSVASCRRCGKDHGALKFHKLSYPQEPNDEAYTHWSMCPDLNEPLLCRLVKHEEPSAGVVKEVGPGQTVTSVLHNPAVLIIVGGPFDGGTYPRVRLDGVPPEDGIVVPMQDGRYAWYTQDLPNGRLVFDHIANADDLEEVDRGRDV